MELRRYLRIARRRWWIVVLGVVVSAVTALLVSKHVTPVYEAEATLLLNLAQQPAVPTYQDVTTSQALTKTYARLITSRPVLEEAAQRVGDAVTIDRLKAVKGSAEPQTALLRVRYRDKDPALAATVVNAVSQVFAERIKTAQLGEVAGGTRTTPPSNINTVFIADPARAPEKPAFPNVILNTAIAGLLGLLLSLGLIAILEYLDDTVKDGADLQHLGLPFLGLVRQASGRRNGLASLLEPTALRSPLAEDYRQLRTNIEFVARADEVRSLLITSARPGEGKTTVACNLAIVLASMGRRVILVDTDLRKPAIHRFFGLPNNSGLTTAFIAPAHALNGLLRGGPVENLEILTSGPWMPPDPTQLLASAQMAEIMERLESLADVVLYDAPPLLGVADAAVLAARTDAALFVIHAGRTRPGVIRLVLELLRRSGIRILGGVLNRAGRGDESYYYDYYSNDGAGPEVDGRWHERPGRLVGRSEPGQSP